jgi:hypothetical protein
MENAFPQKPFGWSWAHGSRLCACALSGACGSALGLWGPSSNAASVTFGTAVDEIMVFEDSGAGASLRPAPAPSGADLRLAIMAIP